MNNKDLPAYPCQSDIHGKMHKGVSDRTLIAAMCLQGLLANPAAAPTGFKELARKSIIATDELLTQLNNQPGE